MFRKHAILILLMLLFIGIVGAQTISLDASITSDTHGSPAKANIGDEITFTVEFDGGVDSFASWNINNVIVTFNTYPGLGSETISLTVDPADSLKASGSVVYTVLAPDVTVPAVQQVVTCTATVNYNTGTTNTTGTDTISIDNDKRPHVLANATWIELNDRVNILGNDVIEDGDQLIFKIDRDLCDQEDDGPITKVDFLLSQLSPVLADITVETSHLNDDGSYFDDNENIFICKMDIDLDNYLPADGQFVNNIDENVELPIVIYSSTLDNNGKISLDSNGAQWELNANTFGLSTIDDIAINDINPNYRFSPESIAVDALDDTPDFCQSMLHLQDFGNPNLSNIKSFKVRYAQEVANGESVEVEYSVDDLGPLTDYTHNVHYRPSNGMVYFEWYGDRNDGTPIVPSGSSSVFGVTLMSLTDRQNRTINFNPKPAFLNPQLDQYESTLNAVHYVVDNQAPLFEDVSGIPQAGELSSTSTIIDRNINRNINSGDLSVSNTDKVYFNFSIKRDFLNDTEENRREHVKYWLKVKNNSISKYITGDDILADNPVKEEAFGLQSTNAYAEIDTETTSTVLSFKPSSLVDWPENQSVEVTAYIQDNAGNISKSSIDITINDIITDVADVVTIISHSVNDPGPFQNVTSKKADGTIYYNAQSQEIIASATVDDPTKCSKVSFEINIPGVSIIEDTTSGDGYSAVFNCTDFPALQRSVLETEDYLITIKAYDVLGSFTDTETLLLTTNIQDEINWPNIADLRIDSINPRAISPGISSNTYDAINNPAADSNEYAGPDPFNSSRIDITIPGSDVNYDWSLKVYADGHENDSDYYSEKTGNFIANPNPQSDFDVFVNLNENLGYIVGAKEREELKVKLEITNMNGLTGYVPPTDLVIIDTLIVDNENPRILNSGYDTNHYLPNPATGTNTYYVSNSINEIVIPNIIVSEPVDNTTLYNWRVKVFDEASNEEVLANMAITATHSNPQPVGLTGTQTSYDVTVSGIDIYDQDYDNDGVQDSDHINTGLVLVIKTPDDIAGNPGNPSITYPMNYDAWDVDNCLAYAHIIKLEDEPEIHDPNTEADFAFVDPELVATPYAKNWAKKQGSFTFTIFVNYNNMGSPNVRSNSITGWTCDIDWPTELGVTNESNTAPTAVAGGYSIAYSGDYVISDATIDSLNIDVVASIDFSDPSVNEWSTRRTYVLHVDAQGPNVIVNLENSFNENHDTTNFPLTYNIAGAHEVADSSLVLTCDSNFINIGTLSKTGDNYTWDYTTGTEYLTDANLTFTLNGNDILGNPFTEVVTVVPVNYGPPTVTNFDCPDVINESLDSTQEVTFDLTDEQTSGGIGIVADSLSLKVYDTDGDEYTGITFDALSFNEDGANTWGFNTVPSDCPHRELELRLNGSDKFGNAFTEITKTIYIAPVPIVSNVVLTTDVTEAGSSNNLLTNSNTITVSCDLTDSEKIQSGEVELFEEGNSVAIETLSLSIPLNEGTNSVNFAISNVADYNTLTAKVTITHPYGIQSLDSDSSDLSDDTLDTPMVDDQQVEIVGSSFKVNDLAPNANSPAFSLNKDSNEIISVDIIAYDNIADGIDANDVKLTYNNVDVFATSLTEDATFTAITNHGFTKKKWTAEFANLTDIYASINSTVPVVSEAKINVTSNNGFIAPEFTSDNIAILPSAQVVAGAKDNNGDIIDGWFVPEKPMYYELTVYTENAFTLAQINPSIDFDDIEDNFPEVIEDLSTATDTQSTSLGAYTEHVVTWTVTPDQQSCWSKYTDGEAITLECNYSLSYDADKTVIKDVQIDMDVPQVAFEKVGRVSDTANQGEIDGIGGVYNNLSLIDNSSYSIGIRANFSDGNGIGSNQVPTPVLTDDTNWEISQVGDYVTNSEGLIIGAYWKISPIGAYTPVEGEVVEFSISNLVDKIEHINYDGAANNISTSANYQSSSISHSVTFGTNTTISALSGYQYDGSDRLNNSTDGFIGSGQIIGLKLDASVVNNGSSLNSITGIKVDLSALNSVSTNVSLTPEIGTDTWYLNQDINVTNEAATYDVTYKITYNNGYEYTHTDIDVFTLNNVENKFVETDWYPQTPGDDPAFAMWSETIGQDPGHWNYVTPEDTDAHVVVNFQSKYIPGLVPTITFDFGSLFTNVVSPYTVLAEDGIGVNGETIQATHNGDIWTVEISGLEVTSTLGPDVYTADVVVDFTDIFGISSTQSTQTIEFTDGAPVVPVITEIELETTGSSRTFDNIIAAYDDGTADGQKLPATVKATIHCAELSYISNVTITSNTPGIDFDNYELTNTADIFGNFFATWDVLITPSQLTEGQIINFDVTTERNPFLASGSTQVYSQTKNHTAIVDGGEFTIENDIHLTGNFPDSEKLGVCGYNDTVTLKISTKKMNEDDPRGNGRIASISHEYKVLNNGNELSSSVTETPNDPLGWEEMLTVDVPTSYWLSTYKTNPTQDFTIEFYNCYGFMQSRDITVDFDIDAPTYSNDPVFNMVETTASDLQWFNGIGVQDQWNGFTIEFDENINYALVYLSKDDLTPVSDTFTAGGSTDVNGHVVSYLFNENNTSNDLADGIYTFNIILSDKFNNQTNYSFNFENNQASHGVQPYTTNVVNLEAGGSYYQGFFINDDAGIISNVNFTLWEDVNLNGILDNDDVQVEGFGYNDDSYPYGFKWDLDSDIFKQYLYDSDYDLDNNGQNYDPAENNRQYLLRVITTSHQSRYVGNVALNYTISDVIAPELSQFVIAGTSIDLSAVPQQDPVSVTYDFDDPVNQVTFEARSDAEDLRMITVVANGDVINSNENVDYDGNGKAIPKDYSFTWDIPTNAINNLTQLEVHTYDLVGNEKVIDYSDYLEIKNPSYDKYYELSIVKYKLDDSINEVSIDNEVYSPNNEIDALINNNEIMRLEAKFLSKSGSSNLDGISQIEFYYQTTNHNDATPIVSNWLPLNNDITINPDFGNSNVVNSNQCVYDNGTNIYRAWITIDPAIYNNIKAANNDITIEFKAVLIDVHTGVEIITNLVNVSNRNAEFRVDYHAPNLEVANTFARTSGALYATNPENVTIEFFDYDQLNDVNNVKIVNNALVPINATESIVGLGNGIKEYQASFDPQVIADYENIPGFDMGDMSYTFVIEDTHGNKATQTATMFIDNQEPISEIIAIEAINPNDLITPFDNVNKTIAVLSDKRVKATVRLTGLDTANTDWNPNGGAANWYYQQDINGNWVAPDATDVLPPVELLWNDNGQWTHLAYDHEPNTNGNYEFEFDSPAGNNNYEYAVVAKDTRGNVESETVKLTIFVQPAPEVVTEIVNPQNDDQISNDVVLTATTTLTNAIVDAMRFEYKDTDGTWKEIGIDEDQSIEYSFLLDNSNLGGTQSIDSFYGVHAYIYDSVNGEVGHFELDEQYTGNDVTSWSYPTPYNLSGDTFTIKYYADENNNGVIDVNEMNNNNTLATDTVNANGWVIDWNVTTGINPITVDGGYLFRAVALQETQPNTYIEHPANIDDTTHRKETNYIIDTVDPIFTVNRVNSVEQTVLYNTSDNNPNNDTRTIATIENNLEIDLEFAEVNDIHIVSLSLDNVSLNTYTYSSYNTPNSIETYSFDLSTVPNLNDGMYDLVVSVEDYAGNTYKITFDENANVANFDVINPAINIGTGADLYYDTTAPDNISSSNFAEGFYNVPVDFTVQYSDLTGIANNGFTAEITNDAAEGQIETITSFVVTDNQSVTFTFDPVANGNFASLIDNGADEVELHINVVLLDIFGNSVDHNFNYKLTNDQIAPRIMVARIKKDTDQDGNIQQNEYMYYQVNDNNISEITPQLGGQEVKFYAFIPDSVDSPTGIDVKYSNDGFVTENDINDVVMDTNFPNEATLNITSQKYAIITMNTTGFDGDYQVKIIAHYGVNQADVESITNIHLWNINSNPMTPSIAVYDGDTAVTDVNRGQEYTVKTSDMSIYDNFMNMEFAYRVLDNNDNVITTWTIPTDTNINDNMVAWTLSPNFMFDQRVQWSVYRITDCYGNTQAVDNAIIPFATVNVVDNAAPMFTVESIEYNNTVIVDNQWINNNSDFDISLKVENPVRDLQSLKLLIDGIQFGSTVSYTTNQQTADMMPKFENITIPNMTSDVAHVMSVEVTDFVGNSNTTDILTFNVDAIAPVVTNYVLNELIDDDNDPATPKIETTDNGYIARDGEFKLNVTATDNHATVITYNCYMKKVSEQVFAAVPVVNNNMITIPNSLVLDEDYEIKITAMDELGNESSITKVYRVRDNESTIDVDNTLASPAVIEEHFNTEFFEFDLTGTDQISQINVFKSLKSDIYDEATSKYNWPANANPIAVVDLDTNTHKATYRYDVTPNDVDGTYVFGFGPVLRQYNAQQMNVEVILDRAVEIDNPVYTQIASDSIIRDDINNDAFTMTYTIPATEDIDVANIKLQYRSIDANVNAPWTDINSISTAAIVANNDGSMNHTLVASDFDIMMSDVYDLRIYATDNASTIANNSNPLLNTMTDNELVITIAENVYFDQPQNIANLRYTQLEDSYTLGTIANITAEAYYRNVDDASGVLTTPEYIADDVEKIEFYIDDHDPQNPDLQLIATTLSAPYTFDWNTAVYSDCGTYTLIARVYDLDGSFNETSRNISLISPQQMAPYAVITGFEYSDNDSADDKIFFEVNHWTNNEIAQIVAKYTINGTDWIAFNTLRALNPVPTELTFNAEAIANATQIKIEILLVNGQETSNVYPLNITYNEDTQMFDFDPVTADVTYHEGMNIEVSNTISNDVMVRDSNTLVADLETGYYPLNNNEHGVWISGIDNNQAWLTYVKLEDYIQTPITGVNLAGINDNYWFPVIDNAYPLAGDNYELRTEKILVESHNLQSAATYSIPATNVASDGNFVVLQDNGFGELIPNPNFDMVNHFEYDEDNQQFVLNNVLLNNIVAVAQMVNGDVNISSMMSVDPDVMYVDETTNEVWAPDAFTIRATVYADQVNGVYNVINNATIEAFLDGILIDANNISYNNGVVSVPLNNLTSGNHTVAIKATDDNGFTAIQTYSFNVDATAPIIAVNNVAELNVENRVLSADITDAGCGVEDYSFTISNGDNTQAQDFFEMTIPQNQITITNDTYSYEFTWEQLVQLVPQGRSVSTRNVRVLNVKWSASDFLSNNIQTAVSHVTANVTAELPTVTINNTGFENGWWLNPAMNKNIFMSISPADGRTITEINAKIISVLDNGQETIVQNSVPTQTEEHTYFIGFVQHQLQNSVGLRLDVTAKDDLGISNTVSQAFGIDAIAPVIVANSPIGNPIDNDNDGAYNEDPINGINEDGDWDDLNNNGFKDANEPWLVDEDQIDFENAEIQYGDDANIILTFNDVDGTVENGNNYNGASGIDLQSLNVIVDGVSITSLGQTTASTFSYIATDLEPGAHFIVATISDMIGNSGSTTVNFDVVGGPNPVIEFAAIEAGNWWITPNKDYELNLNITSGADNIDLTSVVANLIEEPSQTVIQGPIALLVDNNGDSSVEFHGSVLNSNAHSLRLEVTAKNQFGIETVSNKSYPIDAMAPVVNVIAPSMGAEYVTQSGLSIDLLLNLEDVNPTAKVTRNSNVKLAQMNVTNNSRAMKVTSEVNLSSLTSLERENNDRGMSGLNTIEVDITTPNNVIDNDAVSAVSGSYTTRIPAEEIGTYVIQATLTDVAGNVSSKIISFEVVAPAPIITINELDNGWINVSNTNELTFSVDPNGSDIANNGVSVSVVSIPSNEEIVAETSATMTDNGYLYCLHGGVIPTDANSVKFIVSAENVSGSESHATMMYPVDAYSPTVDFISPEINSSYTEEDNLMVNIVLALSDIAKTSDENGKEKAVAVSGLNTLHIMVVDPENQNIKNENVTDVSSTYAFRVETSKVGQYNVTATVTDKAGNTTTNVLSFNVEKDWSKVELALTGKPHMYPSPLERGMMASFVIPATKSADVEVEIFDFAGKLVCTLAQNSNGGASNGEITWNGRTDSGKKLARGVYFARFNISDGAKEITKVVKIAIK